MFYNRIILSWCKRILYTVIINVLRRIYYYFLNAVFAWFCEMAFHFAYLYFFLKIAHINNCFHWKLFSIEIGSYRLTLFLLLFQNHKSRYIMQTTMYFIYSEKEKKFHKVHIYSSENRVIITKLKIMIWNDHIFCFNYCR